MPLSEKTLRWRDAKRDIGQELLQAIRDVKAGRYGAPMKVRVRAEKARAAVPK
jgi:putative transcriptional regulator